MQQVLVRKQVLKWVLKLVDVNFEVEKFMKSVLLTEAGGETTVLCRLCFLGELKSNSIVLSAAAKGVCM